jgi:tetratricopeptide (TPR) repeat protein
MKWVVPRKPLSRADAVREALDEVETRLANLQGAGASVVEVLPLLDRAATQVEALEEAGVDVRVERSRLDAAWEKLRRRAGRFTREAGPAVAQARERGEGDLRRPWWNIDRTYAVSWRRRIVRLALAGLAFLLLLAGGWWAYQRYLAPPPEVREAIRYRYRAEEEIAAGDLERARELFESVVQLRPDDPETWIFLGVLRQETGDIRAAESAYAEARALGVEERTFLFRRGLDFLEVGNLAAAAADAQATIEQDPEWGYGYYLRGVIAERREEFEAAVADLERAAELAHAAGDTELESVARAEMGLMMRFPR